MTLIDNSAHFYYLQTDSAGVIVDRNKAFTQSFMHIEPYTVFDVLHVDDRRCVVINSERAKRTGTLKAFEARTIKEDKTYSYGLFEVSPIGAGFAVIGVDLFPAYEDGAGRMQRQYKLLREINFALNHGFRKHLANMEGLVRLTDKTDKHIADMLIHSFEQLNKEVQTLTNKFNGIKRS